MTGHHVVVVSNDVVPGMGMPVAAPGLRAWGIAAGLRSHGFEVTLAVIDRVLPLAWDRPVPPPTAPGTVVVSAGQAGQLVRTRQAAAVVVTNSNHVAGLGELGDTRLVYDFFAPKMLELEHEADGGDLDRRATALRAQKLAALAASDAVIVNGAKKLDYVRDWLHRAGRDGSTIPVEVVNMPVPARLADGSEAGPVRAVVTGYIQPWSEPGPWTQSLLPLLESGKAELDLLVASHWGGGRSLPLPHAFMDLASHPRVHTHGAMEFGDFQDFLATRDLSIDLFARNRERELAMVTRTAVSLACGLPVVHVPFTECSPLVSEHAAGWLVDGDDVGAIRGVMEEAVGDRDELRRRRAGAREVATEVLEPAVATRPLVGVLERIL